MRSVSCGSVGPRVTRELRKRHPQVTRLLRIRRTQANRAIKQNGRRAKTGTSPPAPRGPEGPEGRPEGGAAAGDAGSAVAPGPDQAGSGASAAARCRLRGPHEAARRQVSVGHIRSGYPSDLPAESNLSSRVVGPQRGRHSLARCKPSLGGVLDSPMQPAWASPCVLAQLDFRGLTPCPPPRTAEEALEQAAVLLLVALDRDHHVLGDEVQAVAKSMIRS